eukprot:COSAG04_NODE_4840_length_1869_cov_1.780226_3_plen_69_part_01
MPLRDATTRSRAASHLSAPCADHKFPTVKKTPTARPNHNGKLGIEFRPRKASQLRGPAMGKGYGVTISL